MSRKYQKKYLKPTEFSPKGHWMVGITWPVVGSKGNEYSVTLDERGFECDCPGFGFHGYCKHSRSVVKKVEGAMNYE